MSLFSKSSSPKKSSSSSQLVPPSSFPSSFSNPSTATLPNFSSFSNPPNVSNPNPSSSSAPSLYASPSPSNFRRLIFQGSIPLSVSIYPPDIPPGSDTTIIQSYYVQAPRCSYLPLVLKEVRRGLVEMVLDEMRSRELKDEDMWFEFRGVPLKWHWPIGLLYDFHTASLSNPNSTLSQFPDPIRSSSPTTSRPQGGRTTSGPSSTGGTTSPTNRNHPPTSYFNLPLSQQQRPLNNSSSTSSLNSLAAQQSGGGGTGGGGQFSSLPPQSSSTAQTGFAHNFSSFPLPLHLTLRLSNPPQSLLLDPSLETCRVSFMNGLKEAEMVRWGNVKRVMNLRRGEQDGMWEGVMENDFEKFWSVASKLVPNPAVYSSSSNPSSTSSSGGSQSGSEAADTSTIGGGPSRIGAGIGAESIRSVPIRVYLPDGAPVMQDVATPTGEGGRPQTLHTFLSNLLPPFFKPSPSSQSNSTLTNGTTSSNKLPPFYSPFHAIVHGIPIPMEAEIGWLGSCLAGADGWVNIVLVFAW